MNKNMNENMNENMNQNMNQNMNENMNENIYKCWKCAILYFGGVFRYLTDKHLTENFDPKILYNDFLDIYNNLSSFSNHTDLFNFMKLKINDNYFKKKLLSVRIYSKIYNKAFNFRITKYKNYFHKDNYSYIADILSFPKKISKSKNYIPLSLNDFIFYCGIFDLPNIIEIYLYFFFANTKFTGKETKTRLRSCIEDIDQQNSSDPFIFWCNLANIKITNPDYPIHPTNLNELTLNEKMRNEFNGSSLQSQISIYGEKNVLDTIYDLRINHYYSIKIIETKYIQNIIFNINKIIVDIYELFTLKFSSLIFYHNSISNINQEVCFNNKINNKYISPIFYDELENNRCYKLSDGYCYSVYELYKLTNYISPMTIQPFNNIDIIKIKYIKFNFIG